MAKKFTRKEIKQDKFLLFINKIFSSIKKYKQYLLIGSFALGIVVVILFSLKIYFDKMNTKAYFLLKEANKYLQDKEIPSKEDYKKALAIYQKIDKKHFFSKVKKLTLFYMGNCYYYLEDYNSAIKTYNKFLKKTSQNTLIFLSRYNIGKCFEAKKDYKKAIEIYQKIIKEDEKYSLISYIYFSLAKCYERLKNFKEAINIYKTIETKDFDISIKEEAKKLRKWLEITNKEYFSI